MTLPLLPNATARRLFLAGAGLATPPTGAASGAALAGLVESLGFVQVDSIQTVARAHHMILFARRQSYRSEALAPLIERKRLLWEHWTHDAAILPIALYPHWRHRFARDADRLHSNWRKWFREGYEAQFDTILRRIEADGPVKSSEVGEGEARGKGGWWDWHPSKTALEWLWRTGALAITRREGFQKVYDLSERVIPAPLRAAAPSAEQTVNWACGSALDRLGFATPGEIAAFWRAVRPDEARAWCDAGLASGDLIEVAVQGADGMPRRALARADLLANAAKLPDPPPRLRILSPFDPALRDRARTERLFGFHYRIEVFVPEAQRRFGYYVFPVLEGVQLVGRIDMRAERAGGVLAIRAYWPEAGAPLTKARAARLDAELARMAAFTGCSRIDFAPDWQREPVQRP
ncbi:winged helix-turn-helix domain-containing protein [Phaeovulum sp.]|uniref:winged helix-turn-helix domain-containing protein n=1 Tax=Phaeovulum sp. TaxID=2934796 RepID=UPI0035698CD7